MSHIETLLNTEDKKFCRDCKHVRAEELFPRILKYGHQMENKVHYECFHPYNIDHDLVTGKPCPIYEIAVVRKSRGQCKPEGLLFEPK